MKTSSSVPPTFRFGVFELDPRAGELRKKGMKIRLQGQPVEILVMLLQHPGETITREELQKKLWPADTIFMPFLRSSPTRGSSSNTPKRRVGGTALEGFTPTPKRLECNTLSSDPEAIGVSC